MINLAQLHAVIGYGRTRHLASSLRTRQDVRAWQAERLTKYLSQVVPKAPFYARLNAHSLEQLPIVDKTAMLADFDGFNSRGVTLEQARAALEAGRSTVYGLTVGQSTGTSGNRGLFVISEAERFTWLGVLLAKTLPDVLRVRHRVVLALPGYSRLYRSAAETGRLSVRAFDLALGVGSWSGDLARFAPDVLVATPKVLRLLTGIAGLQPIHVFSGAEVLDPLDRVAIEAAFGVRVREIYMATEGLFGVSCLHGTLHLAEDVVAFEWEKATDGSDLVAPIVTDFTRRTQVMARYRMNDLLRLSLAPCPCGSPLQAVESVEGRRDDLFHLPRADGSLAVVTPDVVRNAVVDADRRIQDFRVVQEDAHLVALSLASGLPEEAAQAARTALARAFGRLGAGEIEIDLRRGIETPLDRKLRRVRCAWSPPKPPP